jgi:hypothetical protein
MKKNMANSDRIIRILSALIIIGFYFLHMLSGIVAITLLALAAIFIVTSFVSYCPIYGVFGLSSREKNEPGKIV